MTNVTLTVFAPSDANSAEQNLYWGLSVFILSCGFVAHCLVFYEWPRNKSYRKPMFKGFIPMFVGNMSFILSYGIQHTINLSLGDLYQEETYCRAVTFFGGIWVTAYTWFGMVMVAYSLHGTVRSALRGEANKVVVTNKILIGSIVVPFFYIILHFALTVEQIGPYRNLFCQWLSYDYRSGGIGLAYWLFCGSFIGFYFGHTYIMLDGHFASMDKAKGLPTTQADQRAKTINSMLALSLKILAIFLLFGFPTILDVAFNLAGNVTGADFPVAITLLAGISYKIKTVADPLMILTMPAIRNTRSKDFLFHSKLAEFFSSRSGDRVISSGVNITAETTEPTSVSQSV